MPSGMVKEYLSDPLALGFSPPGRLPGWSFAGHPPTIEWITCHLDCFVAGESFVSDTWQDPPPCTALPLKASSCGAPIAILFTGAPAGLIPLQGKFDPSGRRGLLSGVPHGAGAVMTMWACDVAKAMVAAKRMVLIEDMMRCET